MRVDEPAEVAIAALLDQLLARVQVDRDRIGTDLLGELDHAGRAHRERLHGTDVADQHDVGRDVAHLVRRDQLGVLGHRALRADAQRDPRGLCGARQVAIDGRCLGGAAGHARDQEWRGEPLAEQLGRQVDLVDRELGECLMHEVNLVEQRAASGLGATGSRDLEVIRLAARDRGLVGS